MLKETLKKQTPSSEGIATVLLPLELTGRVVSTRTGSADGSPLIPELTSAPSCLWDNPRGIILSFGHRLSAIGQLI